MAKQGMKRPELAHRKNEMPPVPQLQGKARSGREQAAPLVPGGMGRVFHDGPQADNDLAIANLAEDFDMTAADLRDLEP